MKTKPQSTRENRKQRKRTARIMCHDDTEFWTTQAQFWQWVRELKIVKLHHNPLTGKFTHPDEESLIVIANTIFNQAHPNHIAETLASRRFMKNK